MRKQLTKFKLKLAILLILLLPIIVSAQTGNIRGHIFDKSTNENLPFTNVIVKGTSMGAAADAEGKFIIQNIPVGTYVIKASYIGYKPDEQEIQVLANKTLEFEIYLEAESSSLSETVIVTAQAEGQRQAINEQINSIAIKNVVSAAKIQELPDANAAESVGRLPGVSIQRTGGEGNKVVVRGLSPQYNQVTIDGVELPSNSTTQEHDKENGTSLSGDRATDLSMISSNMLGGIEVIKAITPDMDATVLGGVINFSMRKANYKSVDKPMFELITQGSYNGLKDSFKDYKIVGSYEQRFFDGSFGVFAQANMEQRALNSNELSASYSYDGSTNLNSMTNPDFIEMTIADVLRDRDRYGATVVLDYTHSTGSIGFMNFYSRSETTTQQRSERYAIENDEGFYDGTYKVENLDVYSNLLSIKQSLWGNWNMDIKLSHAYSGNDVPDNLNFNFWQEEAGFANKFSQLRYASPQQIANTFVRDEENADFFEITNRMSTSKDRTYNASIDLFSEYTLSNYVTAKVKFGGSYKYRDREYDYTQKSGSVFYDDGIYVRDAILAAYPQFGDKPTFSDFVTDDYEYGDFLDGDYKLGRPIDIDLMRDVVRIADANRTDGKLGGYTYKKDASQLQDYSGNEARSAAYLMTNFNIGQVFTIIPGFRYQNLTTKYSGVRAEPIPGDLMSEVVEKEVSHGYFLPMVHFRVKPNDWLQLHFAYTNTLNYPDFSSIIPSFYIGQNYVNYNKYDLKPTRSENFDLILSVFNNEIGLFSVTGFKKRIQDFIFADVTFPSDWSNYPELEPRLTENQSYKLNTYMNNPNDVDVYGIETEWQTNFWYLPEPFNGIVLNLNYTHVYSEAQYPRNYTKSYLDPNTWQYVVEHIDTVYSDRLLDQPDDIINVTLGYDYADFSFRASMLYQNNIFKNPNFWSQNRQNTDEYIRFDLSIKQRLPWYNIQVYMNLNNITGEDDIDVNQWTNYHTRRQKYGMTADLGLRFKL